MTTHDSSMKPITSPLGPPSNTTAISNSTPANHATRHAHLVYVGRDLGRPLKLYIYLHQKMTSTHICDSYYPQLTTGITRRGRAVRSPEFMLEELGWFSNPVDFVPICKSQPVQEAPSSQPDQDVTFNAWKLALLNDLEQNYGHLWSRNEDNVLFWPPRDSSKVLCHACGDFARWVQGL
ncbi:hypothetical protein P153DRAFT_360923 [Dothidotthia symphoricarpi CBS 119687]|uniref:Uncharacterized protein n=1 Tax=Dothidotthia symphoricarpi CBS 119687 TaxID=1392245 RepID=A0A6A5ZYT4_9PLEO|nr:uncharacterized protein P153DRAFT_360923 [Dothidotthia symphoricarpi CBS 119687]KAF2124740.1 hypothetical protein P153DRAFT_360923 [Dothidotthia symphoricarpi CBS 119687]